MHLYTHSIGFFYSLPQYSFYILHINLKCWKYIQLKEKKRDEKKKVKIEKIISKIKKGKKEEKSENK